MDYQYDVFISYRRETLTRQWIDNHFLPLLEHQLYLELGRTPEIFIDDQLETGTTWPIALGDKLSRSRTIILLWTKTFLNSKWCATETAHMIARESANGFRGTDKPTGLIFPVIIHDGETMPDDLDIIQKFEMRECFNVRMSTHSARAELLADKMVPLARDMAQSIHDAPPWQAQWQADAIDSFLERYYTTRKTIQTSPPKFVR